MIATVRRLGLLSVLLLSWLSLLQGADPPAKAPAKGIDFTKLPPGTIFIIGEDAKDVLQQPGVIVLSPEKFKEMQDEIDKLKKQAAGEKVQTPSRCRLSGGVDGDIVRLQVDFEFETRRPKSLVALGCNKAWPTSAKLDDGRLPLLPPPGEDGFVAQIDQPGAHRLSLELELPVSARGAKGTERGFEINLPRAAITILEHFDVPPSIRELRVAGRQFPANELGSRNDKRKLVALGPIDKLDLVWKGPAPLQQAEPLLTASGKIDVSVDETHVNVDAELRLEVLRGQTALWKLQLPTLPQTTVDVDSAPGDERAPMIERATDGKSPLCLVKLKEPSAEPVVLHIRTTQPRSAGKVFGVGPFVVLGALQQKGRIKVTAPPELRLRYRTPPKADISQKDVPDDQRRGSGTVAEFAYWNMPAPLKENIPVPPPLELEVEKVTGSVETRVAHSLRLAPQGWQVTSEIDVKTERLEIDRLEVELPANYEVKASPPALVEPDVETKDTGQPRRTGTIKLAQRRSGHFKIVLLGSWPLPDELPAGVVAIPLPRPVQTLDKGGEVRVIVPSDKELLIAREAGLETLPSGRREHTFITDRAPVRIDLAWREYRPELPIDMLVDMTVTEQQVLVRQRLRLLFPLDTMHQFILRAPDFPAGRAPVADRAPLNADGQGAWAVSLREPTLVLDYSFKPELNKKTGSFPVPLLWPDGVTHCQTKVRIWSDPGLQPVLASAAWEELPLEVVAERDSLPSLILRSTGLRTPLLLKERQVAPLPTVAIDRVLIQATVIEGGQQTYRARFLVGKLNARQLDIELPGPPANLNLELLLDGKRIPNMQTVDDEGQPAENGRVVRLAVDPDLYRKPVVLELRYQVAPERGEGLRLETRFYPPRLRGKVFPGRVRWQIGLPADWVPVTLTGQATVEQRWGLRGWLPAPRPALMPLELEKWFSANPDLRTVDTESSPRPSDAVCWQAALAPLGMVHFTQQAWLLGCSLAALVLGLAMYFLVGMPRLFAIVLLALGLAIVAASLYWPGALPAVVYGAEPGALALVLVLGAFWFMQQRYRRQIIFMPGFSRLAPGSSVVHPPGSSRRRLSDPSTVDAPLGPVAQEVGGSRQEVVPKP